MGSRKQANLAYSLQIFGETSIKSGRILTYQICQIESIGNSRQMFIPIIWMVDAVFVKESFDCFACSCIYVICLRIRQHNLFHSKQCKQFFIYLQKKKNTITEGFPLLYHSSSKQTQSSIPFVDVMVTELKS